MTAPASLPAAPATGLNSGADPLGGLIVVSAPPGTTKP